MQVHYLPPTCHVQMEFLRQGQRRRDAETGSKAEKVDGLTWLDHSCHSKARRYQVSTEPRLFRQFLMWVDPLRQHQAICVAHSGVGFHQHHRHPLELARLNMAESLSADGHSSETCFTNFCILSKCIKSNTN